MKTLRNVVVALCAVFMLSACGGGTPESVAESFQKAIMNADFKGAAKYATKSTAPMLEQVTGMMTKEQLQEMKKETDGTKVQVKSADIQEDKATVVLELIDASGDIDEITHYLIKEDGSWKVEFKK